MESSDIAKRAIGFVIFLVIIGIGRFAGCDKSSQRSMVEVLKKSNAINNDAAIRTERASAMDGMREMQNIVQDQVQRLRDVSLSGCPAKFKERYQTMIRMAEDQANLIAQHSAIVGEVERGGLSPSRQSEVAVKLVEMGTKLELSDKRFIAANVQLWDYVKSRGARAELTIPSEYSRDELRNMDLSGNLADQELSNVRVTVNSDAPAPSGNGDDVQAVYTAMQRRLNTLVSKGSDSTVKGEERKTVTGKIRDYTTKALESGLPGDFRGILAKIDQKLVAYDKLQDLQIEAESSFFEDKDSDVERQEEDLLDEIKTLWKEINAIAEDYSCETVEL